MLLTIKQLNISPKSCFNWAKIAKNIKKIDLALIFHQIFIKNYQTNNWLVNIEYAFY